MSVTWNHQTSQSLSNKDYKETHIFALYMHGILESQLSHQSRLYINTDVPSFETTYSNTLSLSKICKTSIPRYMNLDEFNNYQ